MNRKTVRIMTASAAMLAIAVLLMLISANFPGYSAGLRAIGLYFSAGLSLLFSIFPFPLSELVLLLLIPCAIALFVIKMRRHGAKNGAGRAALGALCAMCAAALLFSLTLGVQYGAPSMASRIGLYVGRYTSGQLVELSDYLLERANYYAELVPRGSSGSCEFGSFENLAESVMEAYDTLASGPGGSFDFSMFKTPRTAPPKRARLFSVAMSYLDVAGYFFPWTAEGVVSGDSLDMDYPFTIAHEAAHGFGVAAEDEANFAAFLACSFSDDIRLAYSAYFNAYIYASNALYSADYELWQANAAQRSELLIFDLVELSTHLARYETPLRNVGTAVNDTYIKATGQPDGVRTYGLVVDLLLAWHFAGDARFT